MIIIDLKFPPCKQLSLHGEHGPELMEKITELLLKRLIWMLYETVAKIFAKMNYRLPLNLWRLFVMIF